MAALVSPARLAPSGALLHCVSRAAPCEPCCTACAAGAALPRRPGAGCAAQDGLERRAVARLRGTRLHRQRGARRAVRCIVRWNAPCYVPCIGPRDTPCDAPCDAPCNTPRRMRSTAPSSPPSCRSCCRRASPPLPRHPCRATPGAPPLARHPWCRPCSTPRTRDARHVTGPSPQLLLQECDPSLSSQPGQVLSSLRQYSDSMPDVIPSKALAEAELAGRNGWFLRAAARAGRAQPRHRALLSEVGVAAPADDGGDLGGDLAEEESTSPSPRNEGDGAAASAPLPSQRQSPTVVWRHGFGLRLLAVSRPTQPPLTPTSTPPTPRSAVVVGAGIVGCAVALELARRGLQVTVLDQRDDPAAPASASASASVSGAAIAAGVAAVAGAPPGP